MHPFYVKLKHKNWGNFWQFFLTGSLTTFTMIWRLILEKIEVALTAKVLKEKLKRLKKLKTIDVAFWYEWNLLTRRKGEAKWSSMFLLNLSQATKGGMNLFFFLLLLDYICLEWNWKENWFLSAFKSKNKNATFWSQWCNCPPLSKCNLQLKHSLLFSFQNQHDKLIFVRFIILIFLFLFNIASVTLLQLQCSCIA